MIKLEKQWFGGYHLTFFNKINFYVGSRSLKNPEIGLTVDFYDRSFTIFLVWIYLGVEIWHGN
jgi:hypothetical protein